MADRTKSKILRFAVSGMLVSAPLVTACGAEETANEPAPTINEVADPEPVVEESVNVPPDPEPEPEVAPEPSPNETAPEEAPDQGE